MYKVQFTAGVVLGKNTRVKVLSLNRTNELVTYFSARNWAEYGKYYKVLPALNVTDIIFCIKLLHVF